MSDGIGLVETKRVVVFEGEDPLRHLACPRPEVFGLEEPEEVADRVHTEGQPRALRGRRLQEIEGRLQRCFDGRCVVPALEPFGSERPEGADEPLYFSPGLRPNLETAHRGEDQFGDRKDCEARRR